MTGAAEETDQIRVVLADANVLYSRVLRDYLLYAADQEILSVAWSAEILSEVSEHLKENVAGFDDAAAGRLMSAMNNAYPMAEVQPGRRPWPGWPGWLCPTRTIGTSWLPRSPRRRPCCAPLTFPTFRRM